ncbi:MAG TPA: bifunctional GNAT family N-acetyltransferase/class I SAM-dependent methyltransferase [Acidimicrobiales bacterium]|nr:bifunctional GNAT family N-acetyltransferase/class I SAM-dependent methyltransferase [Acidimicrobiales bacterium]
MADVRTLRLLLHAIDVAEGERIAARSAGPGDAWADDFPFEGDVGAVGSFLRATANSGEQRPFGYYRITRLADGRAVGGIGFKGQPDGGCVEIGYGLAPSARGHGYAAEAVVAVLAIAADQGLSRVIAGTALDNIASQRALVRAGFRLIGNDGELHHYEAVLGSNGSGAGRVTSGLMDDYRSVNRASWDERAPAHAKSPDYAIDRFVEDPEFISRVVRFDLPLLGDIQGKRGVHLQCHIGTDTISLARLGARMSGLDFSLPALEEARRLASATGAQVEFVQADLYEAVDALGTEKFDFVYTGIGALCWLPDIDRWAEVVAQLLRPGGRLFIREGHPMLWSIEENRQDGLVAIEFPYFQREEPLVWTDGGTYVQTDVAFQHNITHQWNHGLGEILTALLNRHLLITGLVEHDSVPWDALPGQMERLETGEFRLTDRPWRLAHSYTLQAIKADAG